MPYLAFFCPHLRLGFSAFFCPDLWLGFSTWRSNRNEAFLLSLAGVAACKLNIAESTGNYKGKFL